MFENCARLLGVYDNEVILNWTPNEYFAKIRGAQHAQIDAYELEAISAIFNARANNEKNINVKKLFDADKQHRILNDGEDKEAKQMVEANRALKGWQPEFEPKEESE